MNYGLKEQDIQGIRSVFRDFNQIEKVILYGSRVKGNYKESSDIDITFLGKALNAKILNEIEVKLDKLMLPYKFDTSIFEHISNQDLIAHIRGVGKTLYHKTNLKFDWHSASLTLSTPIDKNYKMSQNVRRFFRIHLGEDFHFNVAFMTWMKENVGKTLEEAIIEFKRMQSSK